MEEKNKNSLLKAINNLPKYSPKDYVWDNLDDALQTSHADQVLHDAIRQMPSYKAPDQAWSNIKLELPSSGKRRWLAALVMAAAIALLISYIWMGDNYDFEREIVSINYSKEKIDTNNFIAITSITKNQRDSAFRRIVQAQKKSNDNTKQILAELEQLENARKRLKSKLGKYDTNSDLEHKLLRIEEESVELQQMYMSSI